MPILVRWILFRIGLLFGVLLGDHHSRSALRSVVDRQDRVLARSGTRPGSVSYARAQSLRGMAFGQLGRSGTGPKDFRESAAAFRSAAAAFKASGKADNAAQAQTNLAVSLLMLSRQEPDRALLDEAVTVLEQAAKVWDDPDDMADWAAVQATLCAVLIDRGRFEEGSDSLHGAVFAGRAALDAEDNQDVPLADAKLQINLSAALAAYGERELDAEALREAVRMAKEALATVEADKDDLLLTEESIEWRLLLMTTLGDALRALGRLDKERDQLQEAVSVLASTADLRSKTNDYDWALARFAHSRALDALNDIDPSPSLSADSIASAEAALGRFTRERYALDWALATQLRASVQAGQAPDDAAARQQAADALGEAHSVFKDAGAPLLQRQCQEDLARVQGAADTER